MSIADGYACPECGEWSLVCRLEHVEGVDRVLVRVSNVVPPPYCPMCGYRWWYEGLAEEAEKVISDE